MTPSPLTAFSRRALPALILLGLSMTGWSAPYDIIICGKGGEEVYDKKFADWGGRLRAVLVDKLRHPADNVILLTDPVDGATTGTRASRLEDIRSVLRETAGRVTSKDDLFLFLIGHGSYDFKVSKLNIDGPDLTADELAKLLEPVTARRMVVVDAASCSAGFINVLGRPGRIVCASTKSVDERNATEFMEYFLQGLEDASADQNRDERISIHEACQQAALLTQAAYLGQGLIQTEHSLLDDNGDRLGTRLPLEPAGGDRPSPADSRDSRPDPDGVLAAGCYLKDFAFPPGVSQDQIDAYLAALDEIEQLKLRKSATEAQAYRVQLEELLIKAATLHRDIRRKF